MLTVHDRKMKYLILELWLNEPGELGKKKCIFYFTVLRQSKWRDMSLVPLGVILLSLCLMDCILQLHEIFPWFLDPKGKSWKKNGFSWGTFLGIRTECSPAYCVLDHKRDREQEIFLMLLFKVSYMLWENQQLKHRHFLHYKTGNRSFACMCSLGLY